MCIRDSNSNIVSDDEEQDIKQQAPKYKSDTKVPKPSSQTQEPGMIDLDWDENPGEQPAVVEDDEEDHLSA